MKLSTAYKTAIDSMEKEIRTLNLDANLHEQMGADYPRAISASKQRKKLKTAIEKLQGELTREKAKR